MRKTRHAQRLATIGRALARALRRILGPWGRKAAAEPEAHERELLEFRFAIENAPDAVFWIDERASFPYVNEQACRSLGYTREELAALHLWDIDPYYPKDRFDAEWQSYRKGELGMQQLETYHRRKDGVVFPVEVASKHFWLGDNHFHVAFVRDASERARVQRALKLTQFAIDRASIGCIWIDRDSRLVYVNDQACRSLGYERDELLTLAAYDIDRDYPLDAWRDFLHRLRQDGVLAFETLHVRKDGSRLPVEVTANYVEFGGEPHSCAFVRDISERRRAEQEKAELEAQLLQAQKMESVGRLAGGVAHEFNNMLSVILGSAELMRSELPIDDPLLKKLEEIESAAQRSRDTTRQLLAFSRKQIISPRAIGLDDVIHETQATLSRLIGEDIALQFEPAAGPARIIADRTQIEQILFNLVVNARDAMPRGGHLAIGTRLTHLDEVFCRKHPGSASGLYVTLSVKDDGTGMESEVLSHVFEPFFTTKELGRGTGLGLATVYGIVKQTRGFIEVASVPGEGTTFTIYFPVAEGAGEKASESAHAPSPAATGRILLVEDDQPVRETTQAILEQMGYTVEAVDDPALAVELCTRASARFDLLISDVVMPGLSGTELHKRVEAVVPGLKVLFMSGYTSDVVLQEGVLQEGLQFIQKPFTSAELARKIEDALARDPRRRAES